ncbi:translation initiation factor IF-2 isoform X2 [Orussus abietinus]|nr:translation initiation factor IF-2 isoform X2 [Orussus abietinus]
MGLAYQNGMTFYNTGAPTPGTPLAPPADPATIYQATGVFGAQATTGHQSFAPVMYPCPAPSLYMPQQYQYSPMPPYEPYYAGAAAAATGTPYVYTTSGLQSNSSNNGSGNNSGNNGTGATSPPAGPPQPLQSLPPPPPPTHFYTTAAPPPHHHPPVQAGPPPQQVDHLYYSFATGPPPPPPPHASIGMGDQQLLLYATDTPCQQPSDSQTAPQEDSRSTSSHSEQPHGESQTGGQPGGSSSTPLVSLMPLKFPLSGRYANYHPVAIHASGLHGNQGCGPEAEECASGQMHCRAMIYHPAALYIPHPAAAYHPASGGGGSLLPTPGTSSPQQAYEGGAKSQGPVPPRGERLAMGCQGSQSKGPAAGLGRGQQAHKYGGAEPGAHYATGRPSYQQLGRRASAGQGSPCFLPAQRIPGYGGQLVSGKAAGFLGGAAAAFAAQSYGQFAGTNLSGAQRTAGPGQGYEYANGRRGSGYEQYAHGQETKLQGYQPARKANSGAYRPPSSAHRSEARPTDAPAEATEKPPSPPPAPYSPMTRPLPTVSPTTPQVQFYAPAQSRYQPPLPPPQQAQQSAAGQRRYTVTPQLPAGRKPTEKYPGPGPNSVLRTGKYKVNGIVQTSGKGSEEALGGAGDASNVGRLPITPPGTPRNHPGHPAGDQNQLGETCHQMQTLSL